MYRICRDCKIEKEMTTEFYSRSNYHASGFEYRCKKCTNLQAKERYQRVKEKHKGLTTKWQLDNPEKKSAHGKVRRAIVKGLLVKGVCKECGDIKVHAHHEDYTKPLEVIWLCPKHHRLLHYYKKSAIESIEI